ncbi:MAG: nicotinate-nucleotide--dimethylbenzimidazole phosphoribosyltransferase [Endomicrobiales bacterium]|jgi:nicotinate-nucleotide--dimethylbenzimidazole phosphoribosyltransferase
MRFDAIPPIDQTIAEKVQHKIDFLTKPVGSLGLLESIAKRMALIRGTVSPKISKKRVYVFAADHGIAREGVSAYPPEVTKEMVHNFLTGGAAVNVFGRHTGVEVCVVDAGVMSDTVSDSPQFISRKVTNGTKNFSKEPAMTQLQVEQAIKNGMDLARAAIDEGTDILVIGDMGIGNTTTATAICTAAGFPLNDLADIGTVIDAQTLEHKKNTIRKAIEMHNPDRHDPLDILRTVGGSCIASMVGMIMTAASRHVPVVLDGYPVTTAAILATMINPAVKDYLFAGHLSAVKGHKHLLGSLGLEPILQLNMRLGEGTGGVLAVSIIEAALKMLNEMATFESAGVSQGHETV